MKPLKVMIKHDQGGSSPVRAGWCRALRSAGIDARFWHEDRKSAFDAFSEFEPDAYLGTSYSVDDAVEKCLRRRPDLKVALFGSAWGPLADALPADEFPIVRVTDEEKRRLEKLKKETGKPDFVFIHSTGHFLDGTMCGWREIGIPYVGVLNAADVYVYDRGRFNPQLACDVGYAGGHWPFKARNIDRYLLPLCEREDLTVKIFGYSSWPTPYWLGRCSAEVEADLYASATVCANMSEPHSHVGGWDVVERMYKVQLRGFCVSDYVQEAAQYVFPPDQAGVVFAKTPSEYADLITHYARHPFERALYMERGRRWILNNHTYHHRVGTLMSVLGFEGAASECLQSLRAYMEKL